LKSNDVKATTSVKKETLRIKIYLSVDVINF